MSEFTVFIIVNIPSLKDVSKSKFEIVNKIEIKNKDKIKIIMAKKYLFMSLVFALILFKDNLFE